jgi:hypothetical protein
MILPPRQLTVTSFVLLDSEMLKMSFKVLFSKIQIDFYFFSSCSNFPGRQAKFGATAFRRMTLCRMELSEWRLAEFYINAKHHLFWGLSDECHSAEWHSAQVLMSIMSLSIISVNVVNIAVIMMSIC